MRDKEYTMKKTYHRWREVHKKKLTPRQLAEINCESEQKLFEMTCGRSVNS